MRGSHDHDDVRRRFALGESQASIARSLGTARSTINYIIRGHIPRTRIRSMCPTCQGPKSLHAVLCRECRNDSRIGVPELRKIKARRRVILAGLGFGRVVRYQGRWAVVEHGPDFNKAGKTRTLHFWDGPPEVVDALVIVDAAAYTEVVVKDAA